MNRPQGYWPALRWRFFCGLLLFRTLSVCRKSTPAHTTITADVVTYLLPCSVGREVAPRNTAQRLKTINNDSFVAIFAALLLLNVFDVLILWSKENFKSFFRLKYALSLSKYRNSEASWSWRFRFGTILSIFTS